MTQLRLTQNHKEYEEERSPDVLRFQRTDEPVAVQIQDGVCHWPMDGNLEERRLRQPRYTAKYGEKRKFNYC